MKLGNIEIIYAEGIEHERIKDITGIIDDFDLEMRASMKMSIRVASHSGSGRIEFYPLEREARVECNTHKLPNNYKHSFFFGGNSPARLVIREYFKKKPDIQKRDYVIYFAPKSVQS